MKKYIGALLFLLLLLTFGTVCAQSSGGCGENVSWELNDSVLSFTRKNESEDAIWNTNTGDSCKYVVKTSGATNVQIAGDGIKLGNGVDLFSDVCGEITELNLARLDTSEVTSLDNAFNGCAKVTQLNISGWATTKLTSVNSMFSGCSSLQVLDLSTLYLEGLSSWNGTFDNCTSINTFVFGANNKNIYGTLSDTIRTGAWYYKERSDVATDAYKIGTRVDAEGLFNNYVPSQMAGTWTTIAKAVTFDGNGDSNTKMGAQYFPSGLTLELKENEFKLEGYQFVNWNTAADGSGDTYTDCQKICPGTDLKLFAQWKIKNVTVSFIANGGEGTMAAQTVQADTATALNKNTFTRGGYIFTGWNTAADGSGTAYANGENITITDDLKLYAQWKDSTEAETKIESEDLDEVPDELADKFESVEQIETKMLLDLKVNGEPAQIDQTVFQDVLLMISFNEGKTWDVATEDNFPVGGLPITISYPDGTGPDTHNFSVSHMFTVTSERLRTTAGEIEYPEVSAESDGLHMILHGLSPVAIAWSLKETKIEAPEFSPKPAEGPFIGSLDVTITSETEGASIHYTTNGDTPTKDSALYEGPVKIEESCTIKAIAVKEGMPDSDVVSAEYTIEEADYTLSVDGVSFSEAVWGYEQPPAAQALTIRNSGNTAARIESIVLSGGEDSVFEITEGTPMVSAGDENTSYTVRPKAGLDAGDYKEQVIVTYDIGAKAAAELPTAEADVTFTVQKAEDPAEITDTAAVTAGGNSVDLSKNVSGAEGTVTYAIDGEDLGCSLNQTAGVLTSGNETGTVKVAVTVGESGNHTGKTAVITVTIREKAQKELAVSVSEDDPTAPVYDTPEGTIPETVKVSYSGTLADGTEYGPSPDAPSEAGTYTVTVTLETADTIYSGSADFALSEPEPEPKPDHRPDFFRLWDDCELPATGFSSVRPTALSEQPKELRYEPVRMRLMLPTLDQDIELVTMPREGNSWTADWLGADAGILEGSALPGEGVSVIAAHNTLNDTQYGPFALLSTMETNDLIAVCSENGSLKIFRVYANELMRPDDMMRLAAFAGEEADPLVLVTCENESTEGGYLNRRVIFARPVR